MERQRKLAETLRQKADAEDRGEDVERQKNWEYTIEENDEWEKKQARKARRADFAFNGMCLATPWLGWYCLTARQTTRTLPGESTRRIWITSNPTWRVTIGRRRLRLA